VIEFDEKFDMEDNQVMKKCLCDKNVEENLILYCLCYSNETIFSIIFIGLGLKFG